MAAYKLWGFTFGKDKQEPITPSIVKDTNDDGAIQVVNAGGAYGMYIDMEGSVKSDSELLIRYREMAQHPEVDTAIDHIVNEAITIERNMEIVSIDLEQCEGLPDAIKNLIAEEFNGILHLLNWNNHAYEMFRNWYVNGRLYYLIEIDKKYPDAGIQKLKYIDARKIKKVVEYVQDRNASFDGEVNAKTNEYYVYNERGFSVTSNNVIPNTGSSGALAVQGVRVSKDAIAKVTSGLTNGAGDMVLSYLHKAIKPLNQLRSLEDATVIYTLARAPERRVFYVNVGGLPPAKAEQYVKEHMNRFRNKLSYNVGSGAIHDESKIMHMLEDFWMPRREDGRATEITTLQSSGNLLTDSTLTYFQQKLYKSLNVPISRLESENLYSIGRTNEITRDEVSFAKFVTRLRSKFSELFTSLLKTQLLLKNVVTEQDWEQIQPRIEYIFAKDNIFSELKDNELWRERAGLADQLQAFVGKYFSHTWIRKNVFRQSDEDIQHEDERIVMEMEDPRFAPHSPEEDFQG